MGSIAPRSRRIAAADSCLRPGSRRAWPIGWFTSVAVAKAVVAGDPTAPSTCRTGLYGEILAALIVERAQHCPRRRRVLHRLGGTRSLCAYRCQPHRSRNDTGASSVGPRPHSMSCAAHRATHSSCCQKRDHCGSRNRLVVTVWSRIGQKKAVLSGTGRHGARQRYRRELDEHRSSNTSHHHRERTRNA